MPAFVARENESLMTTDQNSRNDEKRPGHLWILLRRFGTNKLSFAGALIFVFFFAMSIVGPWVAPKNFEAQNVAERLQQPGANHLFGTDQFGRDIFSRILVGSRGVFFLGGFGTLLAAIIGTCIGLSAGYQGGLFDEIVMRTLDIFMSFPSLLLALLVLATLGPSSTNVIGIVAVVYAPIMARVVRSMVLDIKTKEYIEAAKVRGESRFYILFREILPNLLPPLFVEVSMRFSYSIFMVASLGFLGLGVQPPAPDWGLQINEARSYFSSAPWVLLFPAGTISLLVISTNLMSDGLRNMLQPAAAKR